MGCILVMQWSRNGSGHGPSTSFCPERNPSLEARDARCNKEVRKRLGRRNHRLQRSHSLQLANLGVELSDAAPRSPLFLTATRRIDDSHLAVKAIHIRIELSFCCIALVGTLVSTLVTEDSFVSVKKLCCQFCNKIDRVHAMGWSCTDLLHLSDEPDRVALFLSKRGVAQ